MYCFSYLQHIVFALKFILAYMIPDIPKDVRLAIRRVNITYIYTNTYTKTGFICK